MTSPPTSPFSANEPIVHNEKSSSVEKVITYDRDAEGGHNQLQRKLKNRHIQMISIGGVIGTGLFLGTASSLARGGPVGLLIGYVIMATVCIGVMLPLGELVTFLPVAGGQITLAGRFVDPALAFATGWNYWYCATIGLPAELSASAVLISYWNKSINSAAWITMCLGVVVIMNFLGTRAYGESEFWFASIKVLTIIGLILLGLIIDLGGAPDHDRRGFRYWRDPGPFVQFLHISGSKGRFLGSWSVLIQAAYAFLGTEVLGLTAAETQDPRKNIPKAIRGVYIRICIFYLFGVFILGLICPSNHPLLTTQTGTVASSAWVIAIKISGIKILPSIINACLLTSSWSAGSSALYVSSRSLFGLASTGQAPKILTRTNRHGTPYASLTVCSIFGILAYMGSSAGASRVFSWLSNMHAVASMMNWMAICITSIRFRNGLKAQGIDLKSLPFTSRFQPYAAWWTLCWSILIMLFSNWSVFLKGQWNQSSFVTSYFPIPFFLLLYFGYKLSMKTSIVALSDMDFVTPAH